MPDNEQSVFSDLAELLFWHILPHSWRTFCAHPRLRCDLRSATSGQIIAPVYHVSVMVYVTYIHVTIVWPTNLKGKISTMSQKDFHASIPHNTPDHRIWFTSAQKELIVHTFSGSHNYKCVMVHCVQSILIVLVFSPKFSGSFSYLAFRVQIFWTLSIENKNIHSAKNIL